jgi:hypothetical protein
MRSEGNAPKNWESSSWCPRHDNAPARRWVLVKDFVTTNNVATLEHPSYSPDLTAADFYLFPRLKSVLKGKRFCDDTDIIRNATEELKRLSQKWLSGMFPTRLRWQAEVCICTRGVFWWKYILNVCTATTCFFTRTNATVFSFLYVPSRSIKPTFMIPFFLEYDAASLGQSFPAYWDKTLASPSKIHWHSDPWRWDIAKHWESNTKLYGLLS